MLVDEVARCLERITQHKLAILATFEEVAAENSVDRAWPELAEDGDADGMVSVDHILCSRCGTDEGEGDDVLFCDRTGCCRAYHQVHDTSDTLPATALTHTSRPPPS